MGCWIPVQSFLHCTLRSGWSYLIILATVMQPTEPWTATRLTSLVLLYLNLNYKSQRDQLLHCLKQDLLAWYTTVMSFMLQIYRYVDISKKNLKIELISFSLHKQSKKLSLVQWMRSSVFPPASYHQRLMILS